MSQNKSITDPGHVPEARRPFGRHTDETDVLDRMEVANTAEEGVESSPPCGCPPTDRCYGGSDWSVRPARLYWTCLNCSATGMLTIHHAGDGYMGRDLKFAREVWSDLDFQMSRRGGREDGLHRVRITSDMIERLLEPEVERRTAHVRSVNAMLVQLLRDSKRNYREMYRRLRAWAYRRSVKHRWPYPVLSEGAGVVVYGLADPREPRRIRYVGKSNTPEARYRDHLSSMAWARQLKADGYAPVMYCIEECASDEVAFQREGHHIKAFLKKGMADLNKAGTPRGRK